jgi:hypothetical protein
MPERIQRKRVNCVRSDGYISHPYCCRHVCHEVEIDTYRHYLWCLECGHPYRTRWHLAIAYARKGRELGIQRRWLRTLVAFLQPSQIFFCQCCSHDF